MNLFGFLVAVGVLGIIVYVATQGCDERLATPVYRLANGSPRLQSEGPTPALRAIRSARPARPAVGKGAGIPPCAEAALARGAHPVTMELKL